MSSNARFLACTIPLSVIGAFILLFIVIVL